MSNVQSLIETAQARGLRLFLAEGKVKVQAPHNLDGDIMVLIEELRGHREEIKTILATTTDLTLDHSTSTFFTEDERRGGLVLKIKRPEKFPQGPIAVNPGITIIEVAKFIEATIQDLLSYVLARNRGSSHWVDKILDEKLEQLECCGVRAEIRTIQ